LQQGGAEIGGPCLGPKSGAPGVIWLRFIKIEPPTPPQHPPPPFVGGGGGGTPQGPKRGPGARFAFALRGFRGGVFNVFVPGRWAKKGGGRHPNGCEVCRGAGSKGHEWALVPRMARWGKFSVRATSKESGIQGCMFVSGLRTGGSITWPVQKVGRGVANNQGRETPASRGGGR